MCKPNQVAADFLKNVKMAEDMNKKVEMFCYLWNILRSSELRIRTE